MSIKINIKQTYLRFRDLCARIRRTAGIYTKKEYATQADECDEQKNIVRYLQNEERNNNKQLISLTTGSLDGLYHLIENEFNDLERESSCGMDIITRLKRLEEYAQDFYGLEFIPESKLLISLGTEGGTMQIGSVRINRRKNEKTASEECYIKKFIREQYPHMVMFTVSSGQYEFSRWFPDSKRILKRYSNENRSEKAPLEIVTKHLQDSIKLANLRPTLEYHPEEYRKKWTENLVALALYTGTVEPGTISGIADIIHLYEKNAKVPFWDRSLEDVKYNSKGEIKQFDFTKTSTLVIPAYEAVQIALEYGEAEQIAKFKEIQRDAADHKELEMLWELGMLYGLCRRMCRGIIKEDWMKFNDTLKIALTQQFYIVKVGNRLVDDLKRYYEKESAKNSSKTDPNRVIRSESLYDS